MLYVSLSGFVFSNVDSWNLNSSQSTASVGSTEQRLLCLVIQQ